MLNKIRIALSFILILCAFFVFSSCEFGKNGDISNDGSSDLGDDSSPLSDDSTDERPSFQWPYENSFVENIAPFTGGKIVDITQKSNSVLITIANVEESAFKLYINTLKHLNFTDLIFENETTYSATKADSPMGKREGITINYNNETSEMVIDSSVEIEE